MNDEMHKDIKLMPATMADANMLLRWRNDPEAKKASHNMEDVNKEDHIAWLSKVIDDPGRQLLVAWQRTPNDIYRAIGTMRADYTTLKNCYELSWTVAPETRGKGVGKIIVAMLTKQLANKDISAKVKKGNVASMQIALFAGMRYTGEGKDGILHYYRGRIK